MNLPDNPRILLINVARIGDTLLITPTLRALKARWPDSTLDVWAHPKRMSVLEHNPDIDRLMPFSLWRRLQTRLTGKRFDVALVYGHDPKCLQAALGVAHQVVAFADKTRQERIQLHLVSKPEQLMHAVHERLLLPQAIGATTDNFRLAYHVTPEEKQWALQWLAQQIPGYPQKTVVVLQLKSFPTKAHRDWPVESFSALIEALQSRLRHPAFLIVGDQNSAEAALLLQQQFGSLISIAAGRVSLRESAALMSVCQLYIGVDTGPTHLAGALGIPMVALYHAAYPGRYLQPLQHPRLSVIEHPHTDTSLHPKQERMGAVTVSSVMDTIIESGILT